MKNIRVFIGKFSVFRGDYFIYLNRHVFVKQHTEETLIRLHRRADRSESLLSA